MNKFTVQAAGSALAMAAFFAAHQADAQIVYSGGGSLAAKVYRQLADCWGVPITGDTINAACPASGGDYSGLASQILYQSVGSGAGKRAFVHNDGSTSPTTGFGSTPASVPAYTSSYGVYPYPDVHFAGSDDPMLAGDIATYNAGPAVTKLSGVQIEIPAMIVGVALAFNGTDGIGNPLNIVNATPAGGSSGLNLSRQAFCGIFSGNINQWNDPILTALNGGTALGTGQITVVHRSDGSGTSFLTTNALVAQCANVVGTKNGVSGTSVSYAFPGVDVANTAPLACAIVEGSDSVAWPDQPQGCSTSGYNPAGVYTSGNGSSGVQAKILATAGSIGYLSPDYVQPVQASGPAAANLQNAWDLTNNSGTFEPPTSAGAQTTFGTAYAGFDDTAAGKGVTNPLQWSAQTPVPNPQVKGAYPIAGITYLNFYQCYSPTNSAGVQGAVQSFLSFMYGPVGGSIISTAGFAAIPGDATSTGNWLGDIYYLVAESSSAFGGHGSCGSNGV